MTPIQYAYPVNSSLLYQNIQAAIQQKWGTTGRKPSLVKINRRDYHELTAKSNPGATLGLSIDSVPVVSFVDMERGSYQFIS
jgi:hypothetical protein